MFVEVPIIDEMLGGTVGLVEVGTVFGASKKGSGPTAYTEATNVAFTSEGRPQKRPGMQQLSSANDLTTPGWVGTNGRLGSLYYAADFSSTNTIKKSGDATAIVTGITIASINSAVYTEPSGTTYLLIADGTSSGCKKITGTTGSAIANAPITSPDCVAVAGTRVFLTEDNKLAWSIPTPDLTTGAAADWPSENEITFGVYGMERIVQAVEFGGFLYLFGDNAVVQVDPRNPELNNEVILTNYGLYHARAITVGKSAIFFSDGNDIFEWTPGVSNPVSIAVDPQGRSFVRGLIVAAAETADPYTAMGYDLFRDQLFFSKSDTTLIYQYQLRAWSKWDWGAGSYAFLEDRSSGNNRMYHTQTDLYAVYYNDWSLSVDKVWSAASSGAEVATNYTFTIETSPTASPSDAQLRMKNVLFEFSGNTAFSGDAFTLTIVSDGSEVAYTASVGSGFFTLGMSSLNGPDILASATTVSEFYKRVPVPYPRGRSLAVKVEMTNDQPFSVKSLIGQFEEVHRLSGYN